MLVFQPWATRLTAGKICGSRRLKTNFRLKPGHEERPLISRVALHLAELAITHPVTHETLTIKSELPKDLRVALKYLRLHGRDGSRGED